jgi:gas vesicle protein GvpA/GvpJ/GvpM family
MATVANATEPAPPNGGPHSSSAATSLAEVLARILHQGVSLEGNLTIGLANVDLLYLDLRLLLAAVDTAWPQGRSPISPVAKSGPEPPPLPVSLPASSAEPNAVDRDERAPPRQRAGAPPRSPCPRRRRPPDRRRVWCVWF